MIIQEAQARSNDTLSYAPRDLLFSREKVEHTSQGVLLVVVHKGTGQILTNVENSDKPETGKAYGQVSIPSETAKLGENRFVTTAYALIEEVVGLTSISQTAHQLHLAYFDDSFISYRSPTGHELQGALGVIIYDGPLAIKRSPSDITEVTPNGWIHPNALVEKPNVRPVSRQAIFSVISGNVIPAALSNHDQGKSISVSSFIPAVLGVDAGDQQALWTLYRKRKQETDMRIPLVPTPYLRRAR